MRVLPGLFVLISVAFLVGCPYEGQTTTTRAPPPSNANITKRQDQDVELTARVPVMQTSGPVQLPVTIHVENRGDVDPLAEQLTLDAFYTDVLTGERGPELAIPVQTRPDAAEAATRRDGGTPPN